jgi:hypothetical protein
LSLNGIIIHAVKKTHKKSGLWTYDSGFSNCTEDDFEIALFDTKRQAYCWLLQNSSFPKFNLYMSSPSLTDEVLEKLYLKGKYRLSKIAYWSLTYCGFIEEDDEYPLLCEIIVQEYNG